MAAIVALAGWEKVRVVVAAALIFWIYFVVVALVRALLLSLFAVAVSRERNAVDGQTEQFRSR